MAARHLIFEPKESERGLFRMFLVLGAILIFCAAISMSIYYGIKYHQLLESVQNQSKNEVLQSNGDDVVFKFEDKMPSRELRIITRKEWLAQPPVHPADPLKHPVPNVVILHTATESCSTQTQCAFFVRHTQTFHIESNGWWDIGSSFYIGGDGNAYEGRGWDGMGAFAYGYNNVSIGISFIGTFINELPPQKQIAAGKALIAEGVILGKISKDYKLFAHRQLSATESPGIAFFENIKTWDHWTMKP